MAGFIHTKQYKPISTRQTSYNDPLSVRSVNDLADSINNYLFHVGNYKSFQTIVPWITTAINNYTSTDEKVVLHLGKFYWNPAFTKLRIWSMGELIDQATGSDYFQLTVYISPMPYTGPEIYKAGVLYNVVSGFVRWTTIAQAGKTTTINMHPGHEDYEWLYATATLVCSAGSTTGRLKSIDIQPEI